MCYGYGCYENWPEPKMCVQYNSTCWAALLFHIEPKGKPNGTY